MGLREDIVGRDAVRWAQKSTANVFFGGAFYGRGAAEEIFGVAFYEPILCVFDIKVLQVVLVQ